IHDPAQVEAIGWRLRARVLCERDFRQARQGHSQCHEIFRHGPPERWQARAGLTAAGPWVAAQPFSGLSLAVARYRLTDLAIFFWQDFMHMSYSVLHVFAE